MNDIKSYLDTVCEQIRFQKAHDFVKKELQDHISDQTNAFIEQGITEKEAVQKAIQEMGDPILVGTELDRVHRPEIKWSYIVFVLLFFVVNLIIRLIIMKNVDIAEYMYYRRYINGRTIFYFIINIAVMIGVLHVDFTILANNSRKIYIAYIVILSILHIYLNNWGTIVYGLYNGAASCIEIGNHFFKVPALIYIFPVILIALLYDCRGKSYGTILLCGVSFLPPTFLTLYKGNNAAVFVIGMTSIIIIISAICKGWFAVNKKYAIALFCSATMLCVLCMILLEPYFYSRLLDIYNAREWHFTTYTTAILRENVKNASLFGMSTYLENKEPLPLLIRHDYFAANVLYYCGWTIFVLLLIIYFSFIVKGFVLAYKQKSQLGSMTAFSILVTFSLLTVWNIVINSGFFIDFQPLEIPFFCYTSNSDIIYFILMGIFLSVFRTGKYENIVLKKPILKTVKGE